MEGKALKPGNLFESGAYSLGAAIPEAKEYERQEIDLATTSTMGRPSKLSLKATRCCETLGSEASARGYTERQIGNTPALVDQILELIISGEKRGTFSLPEKLARDGTTPAAGDYVILTRYDGSAGCLVQVEACATSWVAIDVRRSATSSAELRRIISVSTVPCAGSGSTSGSRNM